MRAVRTTSRLLPARSAVVVVSVVLVGWATVSLAIGWAAQGRRVCADTCHVMEPYGRAAPDSAHAGLDCEDCHGASGFTGAFADGVALQRRTVSAVIGRTPAASLVADGPCRGCHPAVGSTTVVARGIAVRHADFIDEPCVTCHGGTGHEVDGRLHGAVEMDDCLTCHRVSSGNVSGCGLCHVPDPDRERLTRTNAWRATHGSAWEQTHGMGDLRTCVSCHAPDSCARCHSVALPHPDSWPRLHGPAAIEVGFDPCESCHDPGWCTDCHGIDMPHPDGFLPRHGVVADERQDEVCLSCHPVSSCDDCHYRSSHPDIPGAPAGHTGGGR